MIDERGHCGKTPWFEDVVGRDIKQMASTLPAEVAQAAYARGQKKDLFVTAAELLEEFKAQQGRGFTTDDINVIEEEPAG